MTSKKDYYNREEYRKHMDNFIEESADSLISELKGCWEENSKVPDYV